MERPYVFMQRALVTFKAAGLHSPLAGPAQEEFWLQLWVERFRGEPVYRLRQKAGRRALFSAAARYGRSCSGRSKKAAAGTAAHAGAPGRLSRA